jgi:protein-tyrosine phosphatase
LFQRNYILLENLTSALLKKHYQLIAKVLFVCLGNICRSPLAEGVFGYRAKQAELSVETDSAGTAGWHSGDPPDARSIAVASAHGIHLEHKARRLELRDFNAFDYILAMDYANYYAILRESEKAPDSHAQIRMVMDFAPQAALKEVPDPYYGDIEGFEKVFNLLSVAIDGFILHLKDRAHVNQKPTSPVN